MASSFPLPRAGAAGPRPPCSSGCCWPRVPPARRPPAAPPPPAHPPNRPPPRPPPSPPPAGAPPAGPAANQPAAQASTVPPAGERTEAPAPLRMTVNWSAISGVQAVLWVPYETGIFREQGLDVELVNISSTSRVLQGMVAGEVQVASLDPAATILGSVNGVDAVLLLAEANRLIFSVMSQPAIQDPAALRGKSIGITRIGSSTHTAATVALDLWGLVPDRDIALRQL